MCCLMCTTTVCVRDWQNIKLVFPEMKGVGMFVSCWCVCAYMRVYGPQSVLKADLCFLHSELCQYHTEMCNKWINVLRRGLP